VRLIDASSNVLKVAFDNKNAVAIGGLVLP
jgi:hypothetical protein